MPRVKIAYDPTDLSRNGIMVDVSDDEARELIRRGRASAVSTSDALMEKTKPELLEQATAVGLSLSEHSTKAEIVAAIQGAGV